MWKRIRLSIWPTKMITIISTSFWFKISLCVSHEERKPSIGIIARNQSQEPITHVKRNQSHTWEQRHDSPFYPRQLAPGTKQRLTLTCRRQDSIWNKIFAAILGTHISVEFSTVSAKSNFNMSTTRFNSTWIKVILECAKFD